MVLKDNQCKIGLLYILNSDTTRTNKQCRRNTNKPIIICPGTNELWKLMEALMTLVGTSMVKLFQHVQLFPHEGAFLKDLVSVISSDRSSYSEDVLSYIYKYPQPLFQISMQLMLEMSLLVA